MAGRLAFWWNAHILQGRLPSIGRDIRIPSVLTSFQNLLNDRGLFIRFGNPTRCQPPLLFVPPHNLQPRTHRHSQGSMIQSDTHRPLSIPHIPEPLKKIFEPEKSFFESVDTDKEIKVNPDKIRGWRKQHRCWEGKGPVAALYKDLLPKLIEELDLTSGGSNRGVAGVALVYFMVGSEAALAKPAIFIVNGCEYSRKKAKRALSKSGILCGGVFTLAILETSPRGQICVVAMEDLNTTHSLNSTGQNVYIHPCDELRSVGMPVYVHNGSNTIRKATANLVFNGHRYGFITAAHALPVTSEQDTCIPNNFGIEDGTDTDNDEEEDDDETLGLPLHFDSYSVEGQCGTSLCETLPIRNSFSSAESDESENSSQASTDTFDHPDHGGSQDGSDQVDSISNNFYQLGPLQPLEMESELTSLDKSYRILGVVEEILGSLDCMVISMAIEQTHLVTSISDTELEHLHDVECDTPETSTIVIVLTSHGAVRGSLSGLPSLMMLPGTCSYQAVYPIVCEGDIKMGDCGSMVVQEVTKKLYGFIFGYTEAGRVAYMTTAEPIVSEIQKCGKWKICGVEPVKLKEKYRTTFSLEGVPRARQFVDRPVEMAELERVLLPQPRQNQSMRQKIYVLCGSGGTGKTQLAVEFAWRYHHHFTSVFWLDGCSEDTLKRSIASCTGRIPQGQIPETSRGYATGSSVDIDVVVKDVIAWLAQPDNTAWLLIFDNVNRDYMYDRKRYLPGADHGSVLVTTRQAPLKQLGESQCLGKVSSKQGQAILKTWYKGEQDTTESAVLVAQLDRSPLVIVQAGAYLQQSGVKPQTYLELYEQRWNASIISNNLADVQLSFLERRVWITSAISYEAIRYRHRATANLLLLWSFLDNKDLWHGLFAATCNRSTEAAAMLSRWLGDIASSETEFNVAMQLLCSYALVEEVKETAGKISYTACPLVHHWTYHSQGKRFEKELGRLAVVAVGWAVPESSTGDYDTLRRLLPHVKACSDHMKKNEIAWHERAEGGSDGKKEEDKEQKTVLDAMHFVHDLLFNQGNLGTAKQIYELRSDSYHVGKFSFGGLLFSGKSMGARVRYSKTTKAKQPQDEIDDRLLLDD